MGFLASAIGGLVGGKILKSLFGGGKKKAEPVAAPVPTPTRNMAAEAAAKSDLLNRRRGVVANLVLGARGAEASGGGGTKLGS